MPKLCDIYQHKYTYIYWKSYNGVGAATNYLFCFYSGDFDRCMYVDVWICRIFCNMSPLVSQGEMAGPEIE